MKFAYLPAIDIEFLIAIVTNYEAYDFYWDLWEKLKFQLTVFAVYLIFKSIEKSRDEEVRRT